MTKKNTAIQKKAKGGALAPWQQEAAAEARADAAKFQQGAQRISFQGGVVTIDKNEIGREVEVGIIDAVFGKAYYVGAFDPDKPQTPVCYAFHPDDQSQMVPHEASPEKQNDKCLGCKHNAFGTADLGKGKRCKDEVRIMCFTQDQSDSITEAEVRMATIPPGSLRNWGNYVKKLRDMGLSFRMVLTKITLVPFKGAYKLEFAATANLEEKQYKMIQARRESARDEMMQPYPVLEDKTVPQGKKRGKKADAKLI
jgi:hypothetical protein